MSELTVKIKREPFIPFFTLELPDGSTEDLEPDQTREWFRLRGANMFILETALDDCWNFGESEFTITNYRPAPIKDARLAPKL